MLTDFDRRQLGRIQECLNEYDEGGIALSVLVSRLEGLLSALQELNAPALEPVRRAWGVLDEILAVMLDEERVQPDATDREAIEASLGKIRRQLQMLGLGAPSDPPAAVG